MFKFDFDIEDADDAELAEKILNQNQVYGQKAVIPQHPFAEISMSQLLDSLPSLISHSPLSVPLSSKRELTLARRDLFDARFQLISESGGGAESDASRRNHSALEFLEAPSDLVSGLYEGGLKTWECSLDLVDYLDSLKDGPGFYTLHGKRVVEVGCGTAVPSLYLLHELFFATPAGGNQRDTHIHFQDYNSSVLELVTCPNIILTWYMSPASASYREAEHLILEVSSDDPSELAITPELKAAFLSSLKSHGISLRFFSGSWESFDLQRMGGQYNIVLTSETIYQTDSHGALINLLSSACARHEDPLTEIATPRLCRSPSAASYLCLIAAKVIYFGVGGGVLEFTRAVEGPVENSDHGRGTVETVWEQSTGVGRKILRVHWS